MTARYASPAPTAQLPQPQQLGHTHGARSLGIAGAAERELDERREQHRLVRDEGEARLVGGGRDREQGVDLVVAAEQRLDHFEVRLAVQLNVAVAAPVDRGDGPLVVGQALLQAARAAQDGARVANRQRPSR